MAVTIFKFMFLSSYPLLGRKFCKHLSTKRQSFNRKSSSTIVLTYFVSHILMQINYLYSQVKKKSIKHSLESYRTVEKDVSYQSRINIQISREAEIPGKVFACLPEAINSLLTLLNHKLMLVLCDELRHPALGRRFCSEKRLSRSTTSMPSFHLMMMRAVDSLHSVIFPCCFPIIPDFQCSQKCRAVQALLWWGL